MVKALRHRWLRSLAAACGLLPAGCSGAQTAQPAPPPAEFFYKAADIQGARMSPSGRWLAIATEVSPGRTGLAVIDLKTAQPLAAVANYSDADVDDFYWVNDEQLVYDLTDRQTGGGVQRWWPGLYAVRRDGSGLRVLVNGSSGAIDTRVLSANRPLTFDHSLLHVPAGAGTEIVVGQWIYGRDGEVDTIVPLRMDIGTGRTRPVLSGPMPQVSRWIFSPEGEPWVAVTREKSRMRVLWRGPGQETWRTLYEGERYDAPFSPSQVDAKGQLYVTTEGDTGDTVLKRFDFERGAPEVEPLVSTPGFDFSGVIVTESRGARALGVRVTVDAETTVWFDPRLKALQAEAERRLPGRVVRLSCRRCDEPDMSVLLWAFSDRDPGQLWAHTVADGRWLKVGDVRRGAEPRRMAGTDFERIATRDGKQMPLWITRPAAAAPKTALPTVVLVHGGPWVRGRTWAWDDDAQFLASRGYVVLEPEFRGSRGYGGDWYRAGWGQWGQAMQDDVADAVAWAVKQGHTDPARVCIAGASYGGYATLMGLVRHAELYKCGVAWVAVTDPRLMFQWRYESDQDDVVREVDYPKLIGDPAREPALFDAISPVKQAARIKAPVLLAFGEKDSRVPLVHGQTMRRALQEAGRPHEWVVYEGEGHGWNQLKTRLDFAARLEKFLARHLKD
jgi:dipeptidyl aminopeptidase/acylaminoacyl peptidase